MLQNPPHLGITKYLGVEKKGGYGSNGINHRSIQARCAFIILSAHNVLIQKNRTEFGETDVSLYPGSSLTVIITLVRQDIQPPSRF